MPGRARRASEPRGRGHAHEHVRRPALARDAGDGFDDVVARLDEQVRAEHRRQAPQAPRAARARRPRARAREPRPTSRSSSPPRRWAERHARRTTRCERGSSLTSASRRSPIACGAAFSARRSSRRPGARSRGRRCASTSLGDLAQRDLAQRGEVLGLEEVVERGRHALRRIDLARAQALDERLRREVDDHDLVGLARGRASGTVSRTRTPVSSATWSLRLSRCWTLTVENTSMPASSTSCDVLEALGVLEPGGVGVRELVDQAQLRRALEDGRAGPSPRAPCRGR